MDIVQIVIIIFLAARCVWLELTRIKLEGSIKSKDSDIEKLTIESNTYRIQYDELKETYC